MHPVLRLQHACSSPAAHREGQLLRVPQGPIHERPFVAGWVQVRGGEIAPRSELVLEVAVAAVTNLRLDGSLLVRATAPLGRLQAAACLPASVAAMPPPVPQPTYSQTRCRLA